MLSIFGSIGTWLLGRFTAWGLSAFVPILSGIGQAIGAVITAVAEIILALAKSPEGRVVLLIAALALTGLWGRWHYINEGEARAQAQVSQQVSAKVSAALAKQSCAGGKPNAVARRSKS